MTWNLDHGDHWVQRAKSLLFSVTETENNLHTNLSTSQLSVSSLQPASVRMLVLCVWRWPKLTTRAQFVWLAHAIHFLSGSLQCLQGPSWNILYFQNTSYSALHRAVFPSYTITDTGCVPPLLPALSMCRDTTLLPRSSLWARARAGTSTVLWCLAGAHRMAHWLQGEPAAGNVVGFVLQCKEETCTGGAVQRQWSRRGMATSKPWLRLPEKCKSV